LVEKEPFLVLFLYEKTLVIVKPSITIVKKLFYKLLLMYLKLENIAWSTIKLTQNRNEVSIIFSLFIFRKKAFFSILYVANF